MRNTSVPAAYVLVISGRKVLLSRRLNTGYMDGFYQLPSGHVEPGEMPSECALRELREEVGLVAEPPALEFVHAVYREKHDVTGDRIDIFFRLRHWHGQIANPEPHKCGGWEWHDLDALPADTIPYIKATLTSITAKLHYSEHKFSH